VKVLTTPTFRSLRRRYNLVLRIDTNDAATWLYASDNSQLIFVLRPSWVRKQTKKTQATAASC